MNPTVLTPLLDHLTSTVIGAQKPAELLVTALLANGHVLIEGSPGIGKTTLAHTLASSIGGVFKRVQFTPDLLPADLVGYNMFRPNTGDFEFIQGPVFANCLLADEINRTSPRVQSALLESMNEGRVSIDGTSHNLPRPFLVIATQNHTHTAGTFPLPEPQLDRFLLSFEMFLPDIETQTTILLAHANNHKSNSTFDSGLDCEIIRKLQQATEAIPLSRPCASYITSLCETLRHLAGDEHSVSVRASLAVLKAARANAFMEAAPAVYPDHIQAIFAPTLRHRILTDQDLDPNELIEATLKQTPIP